MFFCYWNNMYSLSGWAYLNVIANKTRCTFSPNLFCRVSVAKDRSCLFRLRVAFICELPIYEEKKCREKSNNRKFFHSLSTLFTSFCSTTQVRVASLFSPPIDLTSRGTRTSECSSQSTPLFSIGNPSFNCPSGSRRRLIILFAKSQVPLTRGDNLHGCREGK